MCDTFETSAGLIKQQLCSSLGMDAWKDLHSSSINTQTVFLCLMVMQSLQVYIKYSCKPACIAAHCCFPTKGSSPCATLNSDDRLCLLLLKCVCCPKIYIWWCHLQPKMSPGSLYQVTVLGRIYSTTMHKTPDTQLFAIPWSLICPISLSCLSGQDREIWLWLINLGYWYWP